MLNSKFTTNTSRKQSDTAACMLDEKIVNAWQWIIICIFLTEDVHFTIVVALQ